MVTARSSFACLELCALLLSAACGGSAAPPEVEAGDAVWSAAPLMEQASAAGHFMVEVRTSPSPPRRGVNTVYLRVLDAEARTPVDGLELRPVPWMPAHAHGTSVVPSVVRVDAGAYEIDEVVFFMAGRWELQVEFAGEGDRVVPAFDIR